MNIKRLIRLKRNILKLKKFQYKYEYTKSLDYGYTRNFEYVYCIDYIFQKKRASVLDIGSGRSIFPLFLAHHNHNVVLSDYDKCFNTQKNEINNSELKKLLDKKLNFTNLDSRKIPFKDNSFDFVTFISAIEHIPQGNDAMIISEIKRVLKKNGIAIITTEVSDNNFQLITEMRGHFGYQYKKELSGEKILKFKINPFDENEQNKNGDSSRLSGLIIIMD